jgi:hypothetical protein
MMNAVARGASNSLAGQALHAAIDNREFFITQEDRNDDHLVGRQTVIDLGAVKSMGVHRASNNPTAEATFDASDPLVGTLAYTYLRLWLLIAAL